MHGLYIKIIVCPLVVYLAHLLIPQVVYLQIWQPLVVGLILAFLGHVMELLLLNEATVIYTALIDFVAASLIIYISGIFFVGAIITIMGAIITGAILAATELAQHIYLVKGTLTGSMNKIR
ncbi:hypothetical protein SYNTR_0985 [Candidatus Syntrophocurvum alkaliphilum]|uniref:DUF2512 family protein n=1 Tax=Candidatus Syntrophocurvum alkaliphilum TaxID=2293317 RepID=A0A6I6D9M3_9FIRM|nr:DUF2512 family protein [Candidatus Syntrophocurvum alkaliphilum]QGT99578.1 hypothetical protein SYNTR_0985 [Candidatus Syntrophocurvum alkaliphilum]